LTEFHSAVEKVQGGKLVGIDVWVENGVIAKAKITGDFFLYPEETVTDLENALVGVQEKFDWVETEKKLLALVQQKNIQLVGVNTGAVLSVLFKALSGEARQ